MASLVVVAWMAILAFEFLERTVVILPDEVVDRSTGAALAGFGQVSAVCNRKPRAKGKLMSYN